MIKINSQEEAALVQRAREDREAFRDLYRLYFDRLYRYVAYRMADQADAEDVVADVFARALSGIRQFEHRGEGAFAAWLFRIAHNQIAQFYRHRRMVPAEVVEGWTEAPDDVVSQREQADYLRGYIAALAPRRREIITLKFFADLRNHEIATLLDLDERTVASHLCRALDDLRRQYQEDLTRE